MIAPAAETDRGQWILQGLAITPERPTKRFGTSLILFVAFILKQAFSDTGVYWKGPTVVANEHFLLCPRISFSEIALRAEHLVTISCWFFIFAITNTKPSYSHISSRPHKSITTPAIIRGKARTERVNQAYFLIGCR
ncbi:uncharacterized protein ARMOST_21949 [Armillaria ostoyae]|uniref:Uncharacterized protein n=1 Tax=Armillaria ostoyae TaxID=47428 RepID=A0A284SBG9_ARMOS|nr:uncharacterized protein ARMOST_21949 [Armillaria ostoyae]